LYAFYINNGAVVSLNDFRSKSRNVWLSNWAASNSSRSVIANNFISVIPTASTALYGLYVQSSSYMDVMHNSIHMLNTYGSTVYGLYEASTSQSTFRNNIAAISGSTSGSTYALYTSPGSATTFDYNNYFVPVGTSFLAYHSSYGSFTPSQWTTFRNSSYGGGNSTNLNPTFISNTDLRTCNTQLKVGSYYSIVPMDIDGLPRDNSAPTIGAYEVFVPAAPQNISLTALTCTTTGLGWNSVIGNSNYQVDIATDTSFVNILSGYSNYGNGNNTIMSVSGFLCCRALFFALCIYLNESKRFCSYYHQCASLYYQLRCYYTDHRAYRCNLSMVGA
jgi:hypothetical protein